jgi:CheY-like chemotaxis protein
MRHPTVLVVDDELSCRELFRDALKAAGYAVRMAASAHEAMKAISAHEIDAIVCDILLPGDGIQMYDHLLRSHPRLSQRFIFVTGSPAKKELAEWLYPETRCLLKPFPLQTLLEAVKTALAGRPTA